MNPAPPVMTTRGISADPRRQLLDHLLAHELAGAEQRIERADVRPPGLENLVLELAALQVRVSECRWWL